MNMKKWLARSLVGVSLLLFTGLVSAAVVGNWNGSGRSWNNGSFSTMKSLATSRGHTVKADGSLVSAISGATHLVIGEATGSMSASDLVALSNWVMGGGILMTFVDSGGTGAVGGNQILTGLGSGMSFSGTPANAPLKAGNFATNSVFDIVGDTLSVSPGTAVATGGTEIAGSYVRYDALGAGFIYAFADRIEHNAFGVSAGNTNGQLFINILEGNAVAVPAPGVLALLGLGLLGLVRRRV